MPDKHLLGAIAYAAIPFAIGVYILLIDGDVLKDKTGKDDLYQWIHEYRKVFLVIGLLFLALAGSEFLRFLGAFKE